ncbi:hypothetical protein RSAG8_05213, partial [Rhizoctonia solani AG-8 WAC10335]
MGEKHPKPNLLTCKTTRCQVLSPCGASILHLGGLGLSILLLGRAEVARVAYG